jgi:hypothetical protein
MRTGGELILQSMMLLRTNLIHPIENPNSNLERRLKIFTHISFHPRSRLEMFRSVRNSLVAKFSLEFEWRFPSKNLSRFSFLDETSGLKGEALARNQERGQARLPDLETLRLA